MQRREFLKVAAVSTGALITGCSRDLEAVSSAAESAPRAAASHGPLYRPPIVSPEGLKLTARSTTAEISPGVVSPVLSWADGPVGPIIEARTGQRASIRVTNQLSEPTVAHWHGLRPPEKSDGHPRYAFGPGESYDYNFEVTDRAGLYWYHSHAHMRTGPQVYSGLAGLFIVRDDEEAALGLPSGEREIAIVLQDKIQDRQGRITYGARGPQMMEGFLGSSAFVNGVSFPSVEVDSALYRLRVLAAGNARIFRLGLSNGKPLVVIGTDAGFLEAPVELPYIDMGTGERSDLLVDFSGIPAGTRVVLQSLGFPSPSRGMGMMGGMGMGMGGTPQGGPMDLLEFVVTRDVREARPIPTRLSPAAPISRSEAQRERVFQFDSMMMSHTINRRAFDLNRVDERVPFGATEIWRFVNNAPFPHPVHMHAVHFQVLSRRGGRGTIFPWERGWKDTVLVFPGEEVEVITRFDSHRGIFLLHCHNLEHEDMGMMMNFAIE